MRTREDTSNWTGRTGGGSYNAGTGYPGYVDYYGTRYYVPYTGGLAEAVYEHGSFTGLSYPTSAIITDRGGPKRYISPGILDWNEVDHMKDAYVQKPYFRTWRVPGRSTITSEGKDAKPVLLTASHMPPVLSAYDQSVLFAECYNDLIPALQDDLSLANFIIEMKDFKSLLRHFRSGRDAISSIASDVKKSLNYVPPKRRAHHTDQQWSEIWKSWKRSKVLQLADTASDADLQYHYALKPLVRDVSIMSMLFGRMRAKIEAANRQGSVRNVRHAVRDFGVATSSSGNTYVRDWYLRSGEYRLQAEMTYRVRERDELSQFMAFSGLRVTPSTVWNAIPFTFVIDHFTNIGEAMAGLDHSDVEFNMTRLMESIKSEYHIVKCLRDDTVDLFKHTGGTAGPGADALKAVAPVTDRPIACSTRSSYKRSLCGKQYVLPPILPRLQIPNCDQLRLDLDLVYQIFGRGNNTPAYRRG